MNAQDELKRAHASVLAEEKRLTVELDKVRAVRLALEAGMKAEPVAAMPPAKLAPAGGLKAAILGVLKKGQAMSNGEIRAALTKGGYEFSLSMLHVSKTLAKLVRAKKAKRVGNAAREAKYLKA